MSGIAGKRCVLAATVVIFLLSIPLLPAYGSGVGDVEIHLNGGADVAYIGRMNTVEIWIMNDQAIAGLSMGFEFNIARAYAFDSSYGAFGYVNPENGAVGKFNLYHGETAHITNQSPDSILIAGVASMTNYYLPANPNHRLCYTMQVYIEPRQDELPGGFCIDNIFFPPGGEWLFNEGSTSYPPTYQGQENSSPENPDAPPICFDIVYPDVSNFGFYQLDWCGDDGAVILENSTWGLFSFDYISDTVNTFYVNVSMSRPGDNLTWVMKNLPLFPTLTSILRSDGAHIDLSEIGVATGDTAGPIEYVFSMTTEPLNSKPTAPIAAAAFQPVARRALEQTEEMGSFTAPGTPVAIAVPGSAWLVGATRGRMDPAADSARRVQEAHKHCYAGACARSLHWLNQVHQLGIEGTAQQIYDSLVARNVSQPGQGGPYSRDEWTQYKNTYARAISGNKIVTKVWDGGDYMPALEGIAESNENFLDWLKREIRTEDVEIAYAYDAGGAHIVTAAEVFEDSLGNIYVKYRDDEQQADSIRGDGGIKSTRIVPRTDGKYGFDSENNFIYFALSESVESITTGGNGARDTVRNVTDIHQGAFGNPKTANDLHFRLYTDTDVKGWTVKIPAFGSATSAADGTRDVVVSAEKGSVPYCTYLKVESELYLNNWNQVNMRDIEWTRDSAGGSGKARQAVKAAPDFGWLIDAPVQVSPGVYRHHISICNYDATEAFKLANIGFLPIDTYYDDISALVLPDFPVTQPAIVLGPGGCLNYDMVVNTPVEHVYGHFHIVTLAGDTLIEDWFDHPTGGPPSLCGDANGDDQINLADAVYLINYVFKGGPAPEPLCVGDANGDGAVNLADAVYLINYIFKGGLPPVEDCCP